MARFRTVCIPVMLLLIVLLPSSAKAQQEPLVDRVKTAIDRGIRYLKQRQAPQGNWELYLGLANIYQGGSTCLALLALINAGVDPEDRVIQRGLAYLRKLPPEHTYVVGLQTMVLVEAGFKSDLQQIQRNVDWLIKAAVRDGKELRGWSYTDAKGPPDNSNTQYALLGLHAGQQAGARIPAELWESIQNYYVRTQNAAGGWGYHSGQAPSLTMSVAGYCGLTIAGMELHAAQQGLDVDTGVAANCGKYLENRPLAKALEWIGSKRHFSFQQRMHTFYNVYGIERAGRLSGRRFLGPFDWYRDGCRFLTDPNSPGRQLPDGSWAISGGIDSLEVISTSFALLFLSKGRTPILISKLAWGDSPIPERHSGWNNKRHDSKHLAEFASQELFDDTPLAWQVYDPQYIDARDPNAVQTEVEKLLRSPILYITGHGALTRANFPPVHRQILKRYLEEGGFVLAEACCGSPEFTASFQALIKDLFNQELRPLRKDHPVWVTPFPDPLLYFNRPDDELLGLDLGCKTVVVFSPQPLAGYWEDDRYMPEPGARASNRAEAAYRLSANILAYATGMELPKPRLTEVKVVDPKDVRTAPRSYLKVAQLRHEGDWEPAPRAMRNLMFHLREQESLDVSLEKEVLPFTHPDVFNFKLLYMHGRNQFVSDENELTILRTNLSTGATLLADACCGKAAFDQAFRTFVKQLFPDKQLERIPLDDPLFGAELNGKAIRTVMCRREPPAGSSAELGFSSVPPFLEGIKVDGRWAVIYSKYDLGCALEKHRSSDCLGHNHESALQLGKAVVLYALKH